MATRARGVTPDVAIRIPAVETPADEVLQQAVVLARTSNKGALLGAQGSGGMSPRVTRAAPRRYFSDAAVFAAQIFEAVWSASAATTRSFSRSGARVGVCFSP